MSEKENEVFKNRWIILVVVLLATFMSTLDGSIVNVALPVMSRKLHVSTGEITWVVTSFLITVSATILIFGRLGDIIGKTKVFKFGLAVFTIGSLLCGFTDSLKVLVLARVIQGIGASATMATSQGIITHIFPQNERGRALGLIGTSVALGAMAGPALGGLIVSAVNWKYIFLINVPVGIIVFIMTTKIFPKSSEAKHEKMDVKGAILFTISVTAFFVAIGQGQITGYSNPIIIATFIVSIITFILFIIVEKKLDLPLLDLNIFKNSMFSISIICAFIAFVAVSASNIILPFYFQDVQKLSPAVTGLLMMVSPIALAIIAPFSGYLSDKIGSLILTLIGLVTLSLGLLLVAILNENSPLIILMVFIIILTIGNAIFQPPNTSLVMSTVSKDKLGIAGSISALVRNLGLVSGTTLATLLLYNRMSHKIGYRVIDYVNGRADVFMYGMRYVYLFAGLICVIGSIITGIRFYNSKKTKDDLMV